MNISERSEMQCLWIFNTSWIKASCMRCLTEHFSEQLTELQSTASVMFATRHFPGKSSKCHFLTLGLSQIFQLATFYLSLWLWFQRAPSFPAPVHYVKSHSYINKSICIHSLQDIAWHQFTSRQDVWVANYSNSVGIFIINILSLSSKNLSLI